MTAQILDGKALATTIKSELKARVAALVDQGYVPGLGTVLVGDDPGSHAYVRGKHRDCAEVGIASIQVELPTSTSQEELAGVLAELNADPACTGYIVQIPLPEHLDAYVALDLMDPDKDADGLHPVNLGKLVLGESGSLPCTPIGIIELLRRHEVEIRGAEVVVVGRGLTVGRPLGLLLTRRSENATTTLCHTGTRDLATHTRQADIVVAAAGVPGILQPEHLTPGVVVVGGGVRYEGKKLLPDVDERCEEVAGWITPRVGGVGPTTIAMLFRNAVECAERRAGLS